MIKVRGWFMVVLLKMIVPGLQIVHDKIHEKVEASPEKWDDILCGAFETVIDFLKSPDSFEET